MEKIFIFVPVYFREEIVRECLKQLLDTAVSPGYVVKIILIDNKSNSSLRAYLEELCHENRGLVDVMLLDRNYGKAIAVTMATEKFHQFDWFVNFDSDIFPLTNGWPGILVDCYREVPMAGMMSTAYLKEGNNPMPEQPNVIVVPREGKDYHFHWGGPVAGGCFVTGRDVWDYVGYRNKGVYGGIDGIFRQITAEIMNRKCGFIEEVVSEHRDDKDESSPYWKWKMKIQNKIREVGPLADPKSLGNDKGFLEWEEKNDKDS